MHALLRDLNEKETMKEGYVHKTGHGGKIHLRGVYVTVDAHN